MTSGSSQTPDQGECFIKAGTSHEACPSSVCQSMIYKTIRKCLNLKSQVHLFRLEHPLGELLASVAEVTGHSQKFPSIAMAATPPDAQQTKTSSLYLNISNDQKFSSCALNEISTTKTSFQKPIMAIQCRSTKSKGHGKAVNVLLIKLTKKRYFKIQL